MRFHLLAPPSVQTTREYSLDGFNVTTIKFARLLKELGHTVILYASEENEAPCSELVTVITKKEQEVLLCGSQYQNAGFDNRYPLWDLANKRTIEAIAKRKQPKDFICSIGGKAQEAVAKAHPDLPFVEYSIGYNSSCAKYRVFESEAWRHYTYGREQRVNGEAFDAVLPLFYVPEEFPFRHEKEPFALYVGRLTPKKGIGEACLMAKEAGIPLKVIGHGDPSLVTDGAEYLGELSVAERNDWMSRAQCLIAPTLYLEPFGSVVVEANFCGTPAVTTNHGAFVETIEHGRTGYRCDFLGEFVRALKDTAKLDPFYIRKMAVQKYAIENVKDNYQNYFERLLLLWERGWYSL